MAKQKRGIENMEAQKPFPDFLIGGGEMGERIRNFDWSQTPLGRPEAWEQSLKTCMRIMLTSSQPMWIGWGKELTKLYNDPYIAIAGGKHPWALGKPARVVWSDILSDIDPLLKRVMEDDEGTYVESQLLIMERNEYPEETYFTFSYTPVPGDKGGTGGLICANSDNTPRIVNERALQTLRDLGKISYNENSVVEIYKKAVRVLGANDRDFPFAAMYAIDETAAIATLVEKQGEKLDTRICPPAIQLEKSDADLTHFCEAVRTGDIVVSEITPGTYELPTGFWPVQPHRIIYIPLEGKNTHLPDAVLVLGMNPFRNYDAVFQQFIQLLTDQLTLEMKNLLTIEVERKRAESLAEIDKAKTVFFNNISHEFRTPLTLILGPLEDLMTRPQIVADAESLSSVQTTHRNALRLLKLVNTLLDFSRIESGRQQAKFVSTDIAEYTRNLASSFRSVIEKAGLGFQVNVHNPGVQVYIDKSMWEKIVFNLLSNAFKYTLHGNIEVNLFANDKGVVLQVLDTGVGIPKHELPHMFERFHRVQNVAGRTYEGSGIGLSMIKELVQQHGGYIKVESEEGRGSVFTVSIPAGKEHLPAARVFDEASDLEDSISQVYVEEASVLLSALEIPVATEHKQQSPDKRARLLVVDDNTDMRDYIKSLLERVYEVETAVNGADALDKIAVHQPDLILSDVMMPVLDGIGLLKKVKEHTLTSRIPVILLSARAGEEAKIEGYDVGADDYLVKPFSAKELTARIRSQLKIAATRLQTEQQLKDLFIQAPVALSIYRGPEFVVEVANERMLQLWGKEAQEVLNKPLFEAMPEAAGQGFEALLSNVYKTGIRYVAPEMKAQLTGRGANDPLFVKFVYQALLNEDGKVAGIMEVADDITAQVIARQKVEESEKRFRRVANTAPVMIWMSGDDRDSTFFNRALLDFTGFADEEEASEKWADAMHPEDLKRYLSIYHDAFEKRAPFYVEFRLRRHDGEYRWMSDQGVPRFTEDGRFEGFICGGMDITTQKNFASELERQVIERTYELSDKNNDLERANKELQSFAYVSSHDLQEPLRKIQTFSSILMEREVNNLTAAGKGYFIKMQQAAEKMQRLIIDLLAYSRSTSSDRTFEEVELKTILTELLDEVKDEVKEKNAVIEVDASCRLQIIRFQFYQLISNLMGNSLKFTVPGRQPYIRISAEIVPASRLEFPKLNTGRHYCHITFSDNGIGFNSEYQDKVFEVFQRLHTDAEYPGSGVGLAIVKKIVDNHNGFITAEGEVNKGATFHIYLPA